MLNTEKSINLFMIIKPIIDEWDHAELLARGFPSDVYDLISMKVSEAIINSDIVEADKLASLVFYHMDNELPDYFLWANEEDAIHVANKIIT
jgi:hypothetical protein